MIGWLLVAGDFSPLGAMDRANMALARYLADRGPVHLVTHRAWEDLAADPNVAVHLVPRPFGRHMLGGPLLAWVGQHGPVGSRKRGSGWWSMAATVNGRT